VVLQGGSPVVSGLSPRKLVTVLGAIVVLVLLSAVSAHAQCANFAYCTAYAQGAVVTYNGSNYTAAAAISASRDCSLWTPATDNWWSAGGTCSGGVSGTPPPAATPTSKPASTPTAPPTPTNAGVGCWAAWVSTTAYSGGAQVSRNNANYQANYWTQGNDPATSNGGPGSGQPWTKQTGCGGGGATPTTPPVQPTAPPPSAGWAVSSSQYDSMIPPAGRNSFYAYSGFLSGAQSIGGFCTTGDVNAQHRECAAFLANMSHETGAGQYVVEINKTGPAGEVCYCQGGGTCGVTCNSSNTSGSCTASNDNWYYGRGWLQISWDFNYCSASYFANGTGNKQYVNQATILETDEPASTAASLWYWMTQNGPFTKSAHAGIIDDQSFGETIKSINGSLECPSLGGSNTAQRDHRIQLFNSFISILGTTAGTGSTTC
jgi:predicted chitinase